MIEIWKDINGFEGSYQASNLGRLRSLDRVIKTKKGQRRLKGKVLSQIFNKNNGYMGCSLSKNGKQKVREVHRYIAETFIINPNQYNEVNHKNGNKLDNRMENLEWCNHKYNINHAKALGKFDNLLGSRGELNGRAKLTEKEAKEIYKHTQEKTLKQYEIAKNYNISRSIVSGIANKVIWKCIHKELNDGR